MIFCRFQYKKIKEQLVISCMCQTLHLRADFFYPRRYSFFPVKSIEMKHKFESHEGRLWPSTARARNLDRNSVNLGQIKHPPCCFLLFHTGKHLCYCNDERDSVLWNIFISSHVYHSYCAFRKPFHGNRHVSAAKVTVECTCITNRSTR